MAAASRRALGVRAKGAAAPLPCPSLQNPRSALALRFGGYELTHGLAAHFNGMSVVNQPVQEVVEGRNAEPLVAGKSGSWIASDNGPRRAPSSRGALVRAAEPWPSHRRSSRASRGTFNEYRADPES